MRNATVDLEACTDLLKAILSAETEEEITELKDQYAEKMKLNGMSEEYIQNFMQILDSTVEMIDENEIVLDENGQFVRVEEPTQETVSSDAPQASTVNSQANTLAGMGLGVVGAAMVTCIALRKKVLKNKKNKTL